MYIVYKVFGYHNLYNKLGIEIDIPGKGKQNIKAKLLCAVLDLPAKAAKLNYHQFNGEFGCPCCKNFVV